MKSEYHLFIIWERAHSRRAEIVADIARHFQIKRAYEMHWSAKHFALNLRRFYRANLPSVRTKMRDCGTGPFTVLAVEDPAPRYELRPTFNDGEVSVNVNTFDAKIRYRRLISPKTSAIHATNNPVELERDLILLFGVDAQKFFKEAAGSWDGKFLSLQQELVGSDGWQSLERLFYAHSLEYPPSPVRTMPRTYIAG